MANNKTDSNGYSGLSDDVERDMGAKGGPTTSLGKPDDNHNISHPFSDDIQTQLAAKSTQKKDAGKKVNDNLNEDWKTGQGNDKNVVNSPKK